MRFKVCETIPKGDSETVLSALEECLRGVSTEVVREGDRITLRGLGPSPRVVNLRDTTVFQVALEDGLAVVNADVSFQASALLSDMPQDEVVRGKLDSIFQDLKTQVELNLAGQPVPLRVPVEVPLLSPQAGPALQAAVSEPAPTNSQRLALLPELAYPAVEEVQRQKAEPLREKERAQELQPEPSPSKRRGRGGAVVSAILAALLLAAGSFFLGARYGRGISSSGRTVLSSLTSWLEGLGGHDSLRSVAAPVQPDDPSSARRVHDTADPKSRLLEWAAAMRLRDPYVQASFYADPVEWYFHKNNVSREAVAEDKRLSINNRKELWTVKMESIVFENRTGSSVKVRLTKHYLTQSLPSPVTERFVRSQLQMRRIDGQWMITSEKDLP